MTQHTPVIGARSLRVIILGVLATLLGGGLAIGLTTGPAAALPSHAQVVAVWPADGSVVTTPPTKVYVTFAEDVLQGTAQMRITGPQGVVPSTVATVNNTITGNFASALTGGAYTVLWRVTSADGHPVSGSYGFRVDAASGSAAATGSASGASPSGTAASGTAASGAAASGAGESSSEPAASASSSSDPLSATSSSDSTTKLLVIVGAVVVALGAIGGVWARSRRPRP